MILIANGTLLTIQHMTWGGKLGFQSPPRDPFYVPCHHLSVADTDIKAPGVLKDPNMDPTRLVTLAVAGVLDITYTERGLTFVTIDMAGHMVPQYAPQRRVPPHRGPARARRVAGLRPGRHHGARLPPGRRRVARPRDGALDGGYERDAGQKCRESSAYSYFSFLLLL